MNKDDSREAYYTENFIRAAQYIVRLTNAQNVLEELGKVLVNYFNAEWVAFAGMGKEGEIILTSSTVPDKDFHAKVLTQKTMGNIRDVFGSGFMASDAVVIPEPYAATFLPLTEMNQTTTVMIIAHKTGELVSPERLNLYLALAGLAGSTMGRISTEQELRRHQGHLEDLVEERTRRLGQSEQRWATTLASIGDAVIATDVGGRITFMNAVAEGLTGWKLKDAATKPMSDVFHIINEETREAVESPVTKVLREEMVVGLANHTILLRKDGTEIPIDDSGAPIRDNDGNTTGVVLVFRDITERKKMEEQLERSNRRVNEILNSIQDDLYVLDRDWKFVYTSKSFTSRIGEEPKDFIGNNIWEMFPKHVGTELQENFRAAMDKKEIRRFEVGGKYTDSYYTMTAFPSSEGITVLGTDITERKRAEEALREAHDQLELRVAERTEELRKAYERLKEETRERENTEAQLRQAQKMEALGTMSGGIAHDFNNMLAAIIGFTELVAGHTEKGSRDESHLKRIMEASLRGRDLVRQLLAFSRKTELEKKPLLLSGIVKETAKLLRASIPTTVSIRATVKSESALILGDPTQVQQVLMNLCMNAAHAMQEKGGVLDVELSDFSVSPSHPHPHGIAPGLYMKLVVRDTGVGIPPEIVDRIFDPFFTTKKLGEGTGLGLSVVHGIVTRSNGYITVESEQGAGSVFTVYFPKASEKPLDDAAGDDNVPTGTERILFVDDEEALVKMGEDILAELGYEVTSRTSSREALLFLKEDPLRFDLIITDQTMPDMTGLDLTREVLDIRPDMPIIMCTGYSQLVDAGQAKAAGIKAFVMKPLTKKEIARTVREVLDE